ncbi:MAG: bifunctional riboflavin kinase/FAD synthetase [Epulopiscium sp.]|nr:bifunctional riboflavin kinase/FAD synthetase [Candidatus Epulonipiscium sp.]
MKHIHDKKNIRLSNESIVILGNFDGIHIGHQKLIKVAKEVAKEENLNTVLFSFNPHPTWVLGNNPKPILMTREEKRDKVEKLGIDTYIEYPFTKEFGQMKAQSFIEEVLIDKLNCKAVTVGNNYFFGKNKEGNVDYLRKLGEKYGYDVYAVDELKINNEIVSSSLIRKLILNGKIDLANSLIGEPYKIKGNIIKGNQLGRTLGFPTANIMPSDTKVLPPNGAYISKAYIMNEEYYGLTNIGYNPTVNGKKRMVETCMFDFSREVYGESLTVELLNYIRPEVKFNSLEELTSQLEEDKHTALKYIKEL